MHRSVLSRVGEDALLRGDTPCRVQVEKSVQVQFQIGEDKFRQSEIATVVDAISIPAKHAPKVGDQVYVMESGETFKLDARLEDNGHLPRFVALRIK